MNPSEKSRFDRLYEKYLTALKLQELRPSTIDCYSRAVHQTAEYFDRCPDTLTKDQLKAYFSDLVDTRSWSLVKIVWSGNAPANPTLVFGPQLSI